MKLLFDQNLSPRLPHTLASLYPGSAHVRDVALAEADDAAVWEYARQHGYAIVSKWRGPALAGGRRYEGLTRTHRSGIVEGHTREEAMSHRALYDRSPFLAGILSLLDLFGQAYQSEPAYPHASESDALSEDWRNILSDGQLAVYRTERDMERGTIPTQLRLEESTTEADFDKEFA